jgi:hypothetical protein
MLLIRAAAALVLALGITSIVAPASACDERIPGSCAPSPAVTNDSEAESNFVRRVPLRETRTARQSHTEKQSRKERQVKEESGTRSATRRKAEIKDESDKVSAQSQRYDVQSTTVPKGQPAVRVAEAESAEPAFPIEMEAPSPRPIRMASASTGESFDRDLSSEPEVAPRLSTEMKAKAPATAEIFPTGAGAERRSSATRLAMKQEAERFAAAQEQAAKPAEATAEPTFELNALRTAFLAFGGLLLLGTAGRLIVG